MIKKFYGIQDLWTVLVVCERVAGGRQCDCLVTVIFRNLHFCRLQTTLLYVDFAHTP